MSRKLMDEALKSALRGQTCLDTAPLWENDGDYTAFVAQKEISGLRWAILFSTESRRREFAASPTLLIRAQYRILVYAPPGTGRHAARDAADCILCALSAASPVTVTDADDSTITLKAHFSDQGEKPYVQRAFVDLHGRHVTEIIVPIFAITCNC